MSEILPAIEKAAIADSVRVHADSIVVDIPIDSAASQNAGFFARPLSEVSSYVSGLWARLSYEDLMRSIFATYVGTDPKLVTDVCRILLSKAGGLPRKIITDDQCAAEYKRFAAEFLGVKPADLKEKQQSSNASSDSANIPENVVVDTLVVPELSPINSQDDSQSDESADFNPFL